MGTRASAGRPGGRQLSGMERGWGERHGICCLPRSHTCLLSTQCYRQRPPLFCVNFGLFCDTWHASSWPSRDGQWAARCGADGATSLLGRPLVARLSAGCSDVLASTATTVCGGSSSTTCCPRSIAGVAGMRTVDERERGCGVCRGWRLGELGWHGQGDSGVEWGRASRQCSSSAACAAAASARMLRSLEGIDAFCPKEPRLVLNQASARTLRHRRTDVRAAAGRPQQSVVWGSGSRWCRVERVTERAPLSSGGTSSGERDGRHTGYHRAWRAGLRGRHMGAG